MVHGYISVYITCDLILQTKLRLVDIFIKNDLEKRRHFKICSDIKAIISTSEVFENINSTNEQLRIVRIGETI